MLNLKFGSDHTLNFVSTPLVHAKYDFYEECQTVFRAILCLSLFLENINA